MRIEEIYDIYLTTKRVSTDSRNIERGDMFFALKGENFNGNLFAEKALEMGASYVVVDEECFCKKDDKRYILVEDSLSTLTELAKLHRKRLGTKIIGITGTNGKTTTKELIAAVLKTKYNTLYTLGNLNNHIGVPLTLLRLKPEHEIAVIEMGANHIGEIKYLCDIADPDWGIITNIGKAHLEGFGSVEGIIQTKGELYDHIRRKNKNGIFINNNDDILSKISDGIKKTSYGSDNNCSISGGIEGNSPQIKIWWREKDREHTSYIQTQLIGRYNLSNILAAITIGRYFDVDNKEINKALEEYTPTNNRSQLTKTDRNTLIVDAYNANPTSMKAAIENFCNTDMQNKLMILGSMKELGKESDIEHLKIIELLNELKMKDVWLVGKEFFHHKSHFLYFENVEEVIQHITKRELKDKTILIKGSNSIRLNKLIEHL